MQYKIDVFVFGCVAVMALLVGASESQGDESPSVSSKSQIILGLYGGAGSSGYQKALENGFTYLFPSVHWYEDHDWMKGLGERARQDGMKLCPSYGTAYDGYGDKLNAFAAKHPEWLEVRRDGSKTDRSAHVGLSFGVPEVRQHKVAVYVDRVRKYDLDGILLDYTRMFERTCGYHPNIVADFKAKTGRDPYQIPNSDPQWVQFRADYVTLFVRELREAVDQIAAERGRPVELLACVNPDPNECMSRAMQDWQAWVDEGLVEGVVTMAYHRNPNETIEAVKISNKACEGKVWHMPMIAPYDWYLTTDELLLDASLKCLKSGTQYLGFYREDYIFEYEQWDAISQISQWNLNDLAKMAINYANNPGFELDMENWATGLGQFAKRIEGDGNARTGDAAIHFSGPGELRQIISHGILEGAQSLTVSFWVKADSLSADTKLFVDASVNMQEGGDLYFRASPDLAEETDWQHCEVQFSLDDPKAIDNIVFGVVVEGEVVNLLIDDIAVEMATEPAQVPNDYAITPHQASANWRPATENLALGQPVIGSTYWEKGTEYDNAVDGDLSTENYGYGAVWVSRRPAEDQWIMIALPAAKYIDKIRILNNASQSAYRTNKFKVELSRDGKRFRQVAGGYLPDDGVAWTEKSFKPLYAKYIRFTGVTGFNLEYAVGLQELEVYGK